MGRFRPNLGDFFELSDDKVRTEYLKHKAARLAATKVDGIPHVIFRPDLSTATYKVFTVRGDTDPRHPYSVWVAPGRTPWAAACSRGGVHDHQRDGEACSHGLAAAAAWLLIGEREPTPFELWQQANGDGDTYRRLMREHGLVVPGKPEPLPCGWPPDLREEVATDA